MPESKHTPGPWHAETAPCGTRVGLMGGSGLEPVCMLGVKAALNPANVRLIEAAPDLLAACEQLLEAYEDGTNQCHCANAGFDSPAPCLVCRVRAAIAKAKGGAP